MSTKPKHTPGPWCLEPHADNPSIWVRAATGTAVAFLPDNPRAQFHHNARLIAAAPEMLEALKLVWKDLEEAGSAADAVQVRVVGAAIAKAEGRES